MKRFLFFAIFFLVALASWAQTTNTNTRQLRFYPVKTASDTVPVGNTKDGRMWYDFSADKIRAIVNGAVVTIGAGGGSAFWPLAGNANLTAPVTINTGLNNLSITGVSPINLTGTTMNLSGSPLTLSGEWSGIEISGGVGSGSVNIFSDVTQMNTIKVDETTGISMSSPIGFNFVPSGIASIFNVGDSFDNPATISMFANVSAGFFSDRLDFQSNTPATFNIEGSQGTSGQFLGSNGTGGISWLTPSTITNTAANNEIPKSNGTNIVPSGIFSTTDGNIFLGAASGSGSQRTITAQGSASDISISILSKAVNPTSVAIGDNSGTIAFNTAGSMFFTPGNLTTNFGTNLTIRGGAASSATAGDLSLSGGSASSVSFGAGNLLLNGGSASTATGNQSGGNVIITGGAASGTGDTGDIVIETTNDNSGTLKLNSGANEQMGTATLVAGTVTVNNTKITANTRILLTTQTLGGTIGVQYISARSAGTSFTITSSSGTDTSTVAWLLIEPN